VGTRTRTAAVSVDFMGQTNMGSQGQVCGAKTRRGPCQRPRVEGKRRCTCHGGSPGHGAPSGERNGSYKHGRFSVLKRAERVAELNRRSREWAALQPETDYTKICADLTKLREEKRDGN
jgi:hypothetical protein